MNWQPIETAPKDREILGWDGRYCRLAKWDDYFKWWDGEYTFELTHWMPLPAGPK